MTLLADRRDIPGPSVSGRKIYALQSEKEMDNEPVF
jgi:hypothetical protein